MMAMVIEKKIRCWCRPVLVATLLFLMAGCGGGRDEGSSGGRPEQTYNELAAFYQRILETPLSSTLKKPLEEIVVNRLNCYDNTQGYDGRLQECRNDYLTETLRVARQKIPAAPRLGAFILCVRDCPISYAICTGENGGRGDDCVAVESQCIEYCMDLYWRGGVTETRAGRTRALGMSGQVGGRNSR